MYTRLSIALVSLVLFSHAIEATAQQRGGGGMRRTFGEVSRLRLLGIDEVQTELELSNEQSQQIQALRDERRAALRNAGRPRDRGAFSAEDWQEWRKQQRQQTAKQNEKLADILTADQMNRLTEIFVQLRGPQALDDDAVAKELKLSEDKRIQVRQTIEQSYETMRTEVRQLFQSGDRQQAFAKIAEIREKRNNDLLALLSEEQKTEFDQMKGEPFDMPEDAFRRGRRGPDGPGRGQRDSDRPQRAEEE